MLSDYRDAQLFKGVTQKYFNERKPVAVHDSHSLPLRKSLTRNLGETLFKMPYLLLR
jgi:hypothetical protein